MSANVRDALHRLQEVADTWKPLPSGDGVGTVRILRSDVDALAPLLRLLDRAKTEPTAADVEAVEQAVGVGKTAWDMENPRTIITAAWRVLLSEARPSLEHPNVGYAMRTEQ